MTRSPRFWLVVAVLFVLINAGGGLYALRMEEGWHALTHFLLLVPGGFWMGWLMRKRRAVPNSEIEPDYAEARLQRIEQIVESVAVDVERVGEAQRYMTRVLTESESPETSPPTSSRPNPLHSPRSSTPIE